MLLHTGNISLSEMTGETPACSTSLQSCKKAHVPNYKVYGTHAVVDQLVEVLTPSMFRRVDGLDPHRQSMPSHLVVIHQIAGHVFELKLKKLS